MPSKHSADKMHRDIQNAIVSLKLEGYSRDVLLAAHVSVNSSNAEQIADIVGLDDSSVWKRYYCDNCTINQMKNSLYLSDKDIRNLMDKDIGKIARVFTERET